MPGSMRALLLALLLIGCTKSEATVSPEAAKTEATPTAVAQQPGAVAFPQTVPATPAPAVPAAEESTCGGGGACCGGGGGSCCGGAMADTATIPTDAPATAAWSTVKVDGMRCGRCAKKIMAALGKVEGIVAVQADATTGQVRWAVDPGHDAQRDGVIAEIRKLGYQPQL